MDASTTRLWTASELAEEFGITARALRFYETKDLLSPQRVGSTRAYTHRDRGRLKLILRGKRLGFSLADIKTYLDLYDLDTERVEQLHVLRRKVSRRIVELEQQREDIEVALEELRDIDAQAIAALAEKGVVPEPS